MTYLFKLARRAARLRALPLIALVSALGACDSDRLTNSSDEPGTVPTAEPGDAPSFATSFRGGLPFGTFAQPTSVFGDVYNGALRNIWPEELLQELAAIKSRGGKVVLMFAGNEENYKDGNGHFSLSMWKDRIDRFKGVNFSSYVTDGTIIGHYLIDEPNDPFNWNGQPVPGTTLEDMAAYSKQIWPNMATIVRVEPGYLAQWSITYKYLDVAWAQYTIRKGSPGDYIARNVADAKSKGLALVVGLNIIKGGTDGGEMTANQVETAGSALLADSYPCAFISWQYDERYLSRSDIKTAMSHLSQKAAAHVDRSCGSSADAPTPIGGISGIVLTAARRVDGDGIQYVALDWAGAAETRVDLYRNGVFKRSTPNDGHAVNYPQAPGKYTYKVCDAGKTRCSSSVSVTLW
jgi:hypothetical protein